ncbi:hypothetical protein TSAR_008165 [Trichomalopsis sarcophagae]|uniref:Uncharacterized protein n=1 Tax=Trichomalopsis sarcophagae TaxID=543379 RepID=A0A232EJQ1_9HYME|nr:hypothetical protein TSAR_008165 [Trichomalopsis sarcophagae]
MEDHTGVYEQVIDASSTNPGSELVSSHLVQEIVVENDDRESSMNCGLSDGSEINLKNDSTNIHNNIETIKQDQICENYKNLASDNPRHKEQNIDNSVPQNQASDHKGITDFNDSTSDAPKSETDCRESIAEAILDPNESVPVINVNDTVPNLSKNQTLDDYNVLNNDQNIMDNLVTIKDEHTDKCDQAMGNIVTNKKETDSIIDNMQSEKIESMEIKSVSIDSEGGNENVNIAIEEIPVKSHCTDDANERYDNLKFKQLNSEITEEGDHPVLIEESIKATNIVINSDDVAVLTEFSSVEYNIQTEITKKEGVKVETEHKLHQITKSGTIKNSQDLTDNMLSIDMNNQESKHNDVSIYDELTNEEDEDELNLHLSSQSTENHRKVIQDIFDDWQDENGEEEVNQPSSTFKDNHDSVELELQSLLNDGAQQEETDSSINIEVTEKSSTENSKTKFVKSDKLSQLDKTAMEVKTFAQNKSPKLALNSTSIKDLSLGHLPRTLSQDELLDQKQKQQSPRPGVKVPGIHLTSQIASTTEVNEALKERLREKQKDLVTPKTVDIVFVKKITQRLSSQLSGAVSVPPLIPLQSTPITENHKIKDNKSETSEDEKFNKISSSTTADKELLAILEGDVDPDWSNLKSVTDESNKVSNSGEPHSTDVCTRPGSKLDPAVERELALKQLLELPNIPAKKNNPVSLKKIKKTGRSSNVANEVLESKSVDEIKTEIISLDSAEEESPKKSKTPKALKENNNQNMHRAATDTVIIDLGVEESRSGRKRKLTEKAREHELSVKRQKVPKVKPGPEKKSLHEFSENSKHMTDFDSPAINKSTNTSKAALEPNSSSPPKCSQTKLDAKQNKPEVKQSKVDIKAASSKSEIKQTGAKMAGTKGKITLVKPSKIGLLKKDVPISKRKLAVKNLLRQKMADKKSSIVRTKGQVSEKSLATGLLITKPKKVVTEIDKLLQDEGVVNLLYDVEQPDLKKRLIPITKSQKKVMDVEKAERELKLRTKLVRNAVLRLRNSNASAVKISPRSRRNMSVTENVSTQSEKKCGEPTKSPKSPVFTSASSDFIIPAKIRNAADASRIIRRHSSSSFSSASASPRVSIDMPPESIKLDESDLQTKSKRKLSHDSVEKPDTRKIKKKLAPKEEIKDTESSEKSSTKKELAKKITTRSNITSVSSTASIKTVCKNKKVPKNKTSSETLTNDAKSLKGQDELSACLAEAATALLSGISTIGSSRLSSGSTSRKKGSTNFSKTDDERVDSKKLFSNKEINVRHHGHLVQLILTPSTPVSGIRNAITVQVMNEMREALSILKNDDDCRVVLFTSTGTSFCEGLEVSALLQSNKDERKVRAEETAMAVKNFIKELAAFNKPIVAGVQGAAIGLGVTMLPLFDLVIASDKATFSTPYGKLGQIAEGAAVLTLSHSLGSAVTNELLLGGRVLTASEALRAGLVTRVLWPDRFQGELLPSLKTMSEQSSQSMEATKALLRQSLRQKLEMALESETLLLVKHWCSPECQEAMKIYIEEKGQ